MGKLLRALNLEKPLPEDLKATRREIVEAEAKLGLDKVTAKALALTANAKAVVENLNDLEGKIEPALLQGKRYELESLAKRLGERKAGDPALITDAKELQMLRAETALAVKPSTKNQEALTQAQLEYGESLVARLDKGGDHLALAAELKTYIDTLVGNNSEARLGAALKALTALKQSEDERLKKASVEVAKQLAKKGQQRQKDMGPSDAPRDVSRTPNDVLVHLMTAIGESVEVNDDPKLKKILADGRRMFMSHTPSTGAVNDLIDRAKQALIEAGDGPNALLCDKLKGQMPESDDKLTAPQMQDNLYGRVFDSKMIGALVKNPPDELLSSSAEAGKAFVATLLDDKDNEMAAAYLREHYIEHDVRPWSKPVKAFETIAQAKSGKEALEEIKKFLSTPPTTGHEIIAFSYLMAKMTIAQQQRGTAPGFMQVANENYGNVIQKQAVRERGASSMTKVMSEGAGITMLHQPNSVEDDELVPSERPGTFNRFGNRGRTGDVELETVQENLSQATKLQHEHALPFASGVSGTTNILLHLFKDLKDKGLQGVSAKEFMMNAMMFLVYDGGHSMHEVMWTANQLDLKLGLGLGLGDPDTPEEFVSDYDGLVDIFDGELKTSMQEAMNDAWSGTQKYLEKNSVFA